MKTFKQYLAEESEGDSVTFSIPLFIRLLEWAREDAKTDEQLHVMTEKAIAMNKKECPLDMDDYAELVGKK